ncbi:glucokinase [Palleronia aestuarii]|uniref:Glucokinase n=1 Tax=Palleronia aestuarii TaxID=568105 RepID=A0A2W7NNM5_9RHOB|nr:glucokinase [Palleronia aestuarii]
MQFAGLDIRREKISACLVDLRGEMTAFDTRELSIGASRGDVLSAIDALLVELMGAAVSPVTALGVGSVGPVVGDEGVIQSIHFPALRGFDIAGYLERVHGIPVTIQTGAVAAAYGEERIARRQQRPATSVAFVVIDYAGIGLGLISGGEGWITDHGGVGELGHLSIDRAGRACECGRRGCLLQYSSGRAVLQALGRLDGDDGAAFARVARNADAGDEAAQAALIEAGDHLAHGIVDADSLLRPGRIVLGSSHPRMADWYLQGVRRHLDGLPDREGGRALRDRLYLSELGTAAICYGAANRELKAFLDAPDAHVKRLGASSADAWSAAEGDRSTAT